MSQVGIITGAAGGVGRVTAERFAKDGYDLALVDVVGSVKEVAAEIAKASGRKVIGVTAELTREENFGPVDAAVRELGGQLKFLGLIAGVLQKVGAIETLEADEWDRVFNVNVRANFLLMKHYAPMLKAAGGGSIVTVSSWYGRSGHAFFSAYCASKAALISLTQTAAAELTGHKIRVNSVAPGNVATSMHFTALREEADKRGISFEEMKKIEWDKIPISKASDPGDIAAAIAFLASKDAESIVGATIDVNGGVLFS